MRIRKQAAAVATAAVIAVAASSTVFAGSAAAAGPPEYHGYARCQTPFNPEWDLTPPGWFTRKAIAEVRRSPAAVDCSAGTFEFVETSE